MVANHTVLLMIVASKPWYVHALELKCQTPNGRYFCKVVISSTVRMMRKRIKKKLEVMQYVSLTTDTRSSDVNNDSLFSVTAHWIDDNWQPLSVVLQAHSLEERHTGEYIYSHEDV